jgi:organic radical activating enzyme
MTLPVAEVFGPVWQGEGPHAGRRCTFLRLGLCNLHCSWCDTPFTWDTGRYDVAAECPQRDEAWLDEELSRQETDLLILSGGEPMIHARNPTLLHALAGWSGAVHVETNGTLLPSLELAGRVEHWMVSPKLGNGGDPAGRRLRPAVLAYFADLAGTGRASFKFVVVEPGDLDEVEELAHLAGIPTQAVWIMPEGTDAACLLARARSLAEGVAERGWNLTLRQQVLLYGTRRGT